MCNILTLPVWRGTGNPWECECDLHDLWDWLQDHLSTVEQVNTLTCNAPQVSILIT